MSRIGKKPVDLPSGVTATLSGQTIEVKGPKATQTFTATDDVTLTVEENVVKITPRGNSKRARQQWGMSRTVVANMVTGVSVGFKKELEINGVGYRASMTDAKTLKLMLGLSHDVNYEVPEGVTVTCPKQTEIIIEGDNAQLVGQVAATNARVAKEELTAGSAEHPVRFAERLTAAADDTVFVTSKLPATWPPQQPLPDELGLCVRDPRIEGAELLAQPLPLDRFGGGE